MLTAELSRFREQMTGYTELRVQENTTQTIRILNGSVTTNQKTRTGGVSARIHRNGAWGFASYPAFAEDAVQSVLRESSENAGTLAHLYSHTADLPSRPLSARHDFRTGKTQPSTKEILDFLYMLDGYISEKYPDLLSRSMVFSSFDHEKNLLTSDGAESYLYLPNAHIFISMSLDRDGAPVELRSRSLGGRGGFADLFTSPEALHQTIDQIYEDVRRKKEGIYPEAGLKDCIMGPDLAGILAHEAVGHTVEADLVRAGSVAADLMEKQVAAPCVSMVDFAHTAFGETVPVPVYVDDEGTEARDAVLIDNGILKGYMHNKESALQYSAEPVGNARGYAFSDEPLIRMRNTCILPGEYKLENMVASVEDGYYLCNPSNGQADMTGEFMFGVTMGYEIKNGKRGRALLDTTVSGVAFEMLKTVTMVSDDMEWISSGWCGKKQPMRVSMGGPAIRCKITIGGR